MDADGVLTFKIHHGGKFVNAPLKKYVGGGVEYFEHHMADTLSMNVFDRFVEKLGYDGSIKYYYLVPALGIENGLRLLATTTVKDILNYHQKDGVDFFYIYVDCVSLTDCLGVQSGSSSSHVQDGGLHDIPIRVDDSQDSDSDMNYEVNEDCSDGEDDYHYDENVDLDVEWGGLRDRGSADFGVGKFNHLESDHGGSADEDGSDFEWSSDDDIPNKAKFPKFNPKMDLRCVQFTEGLTFSTANEFRAALRDYAILNGKEIKWLINDATRLRAGCGKGCKWEIYVSPMNNESTLQVKTLKDVHTCSRVFYNKLATCSWIASKYLQDLRSNPKMPIKSLKVKLQEEWVVYASKKQLYDAKKVARKIIEGCDREQYGRLYDYCYELRRTNPGTTTKIDTIDGPNGEKVFQRMYICLSALKKGMRESCRPIIGLDGCHLRGTHTGQVLCAVGLDGNNQSYPFAYAIVEIENKDSWKWFLNLIAEDIGIINSNHWTFISDKQKGLVPALEEDYPNAEHRTCVKHLYANFMTENRGLLLKKLFYKAARASSEPEFNSVMLEVKSTHKGAFEWLSKRPPRQWSKAFYRTHCKTDMQINNSCESLNGTIKDARELPIFKLVESIRELLMDRSCERRNTVGKHHGEFCPNIEAKLEKLKIEAGKCHPKESGRGWYQVDVTNGGLFAVNIDQRTCGCRIWDITGIPCSHAISAIYSIREKPEDYVDDCYRLSTYIKAYEEPIFPINGPDLWERTCHIPPAPPYYQRQPGRPKMSRNLSADERLTGKRKRRNGNQGKINGRKVLVCGNCGQKDHNKRTCKNPTNLEHQRKNLPRWKDKNAEAIAREAAKSYSATLPKNKGGRPKKNHDSTYTSPPTPTPTMSSSAPAGYSGVYDAPPPSNNSRSSRSAASSRPPTSDPAPPPSTHSAFSRTTSSSRPPTSNFAPPPTTSTCIPGLSTQCSKSPPTAPPKGSQRFRRIMNSTQLLAQAAAKFKKQ